VACYSARGSPITPFDVECRVTDPCFLAFDEPNMTQFQNSFSRWSTTSGLCPPGVNLFRMWRMHRLDQIRRHKPAKMFDFIAVTLEIRVQKLWPVYLTILLIERGAPPRQRHARFAAV
jgi:hypothetical protein